jgi:hypothetical protein
MKGEGNRVEVERLPHLSELAHEGQAVEIASVQDPETGATRYSTRTGTISYQVQYPYHFLIFHSSLISTGIMSCTGKSKRR